MVNHFGMAEGPMICNRWNGPREPQMNTIGFPMFLDPQVQIRIFNDKNEEVGIGEIGEMVAKSPLNFRGYFRNPEENQSRARDCDCKGQEQNARVRRQDNV
jgi:non-ribosomal peptide synthetase component E (peptide arylation enzyme)